jgi:hypothetical protein
MSRIPRPCKRPNPAHRCPRKPQALGRPTRDRWSSDRRNGPPKARLPFPPASPRRGHPVPRRAEPPPGRGAGPRKRGGGVFGDAGGNGRRSERTALRAEPPRGSAGLRTGRTVPRKPASRSSPHRPGVVTRCRSGQRLHRERGASHPRKRGDGVFGDAGGNGRRSEGTALRGRASAPPVEEPAAGSGPPLRRCTSAAAAGQSLRPGAPVFGPAERSPAPAAQPSARCHASSLNPTSTIPSPTTNGRFTRLPLPASSATASSAVIAGSLSFNPSSR